VSALLCGDFRGRLRLYLEDALTSGERGAFRDHLVSCAGCRDHVALTEPSLLFAGMPAERVSPEDVERVLAGVRTGIALAETRRRLGRVGRPGRRRIAAMSSAAALAAMIFVLPGSNRRSAESAASAPAVLAPAPGFANASEKAPSSTFPEDATIYDWNPGAAAEEPRVVWIVDRSLDI
jgi:hypothetical protein